MTGSCNPIFYPHLQAEGRGRAARKPCGRHLADRGREGRWRIPGRVRGLELWLFALGLGFGGLRQVIERFYYSFPLVLLVR